jgi:hypothetical protein
MRRLNLKFIYSVAAVIAVFMAAGNFLSIGSAETAGENRTGIVIRGRVISEYGPVENARVRAAGDEKYTLTDRQGRYELATARPPGTRFVRPVRDSWSRPARRAGLTTVRSPMLPAAYAIYS